MTETKDKEGKKLSLSGRKTLHLRKAVETGQVRQSFSHGRSKTVVVERKRKRSIAVAGKPAPVEPPVMVAMDPLREVPGAEEVPSAPKPRVVLKTLTDDEKAVRARALKGATEAANIARQRAVEEARRRAVEEARAAEEKVAAELRRSEEEARKKSEEEARIKAEERAARRLAAERDSAEQGVPQAGSGPSRTAGAGAHASRARSRSLGRDGPGPRAHGPRRGPERRRGRKITVVQALDGRDERQRSLASMRRARAREKRLAEGVREPPKKIYREVVIPDIITVQELAGRMTERASDVVRALVNMGVTATINETVDADTAELIVAEFGHSAKRVSEADVEIGLGGTEDRAKDLKPRPPVVTVMGHVDHGKTSLLDAFRKTNVVAGEAGGITQHIGAYQIEHASGQKITFIDTPGHAAFTAMRARGAKVTDIVVLVVAADDGIMPQTIEAIDHAKAAGAPVIVAINKIDKRSADADKVRKELLQHELVVEEMGGDVLNIEVSATKNLNLDKLQEMILLQAELLELRANPDRPAEGSVIEAKLDKGRGVVATLLVRRGTIRVGDVVVAGAEWGKVRALLDERGDRLKEAGPSQPVEVLGLSAPPVAGDSFAVTDSEARAREVATFRQRQIKLKSVAKTEPVSLETMFSRLQESETSELPVVIKADTQGSVEAILGSLEKLSTDEVSVNILHGGTGAITETDISLGQSSGGVVFGFNVRATKQAIEFAQRSDVEIRYYAVIYELIDDIKAALSGLLAPAIQETAVGAAEIREIFSVSKIGKVAGCIVTEGLVRGGANARLIRDSVVVYEGKISTLRRFKDEVREVNAGTECGLSLENYQDFKTGDKIEVFEVEEIARTL